MGTRRKTDQEIAANAQKRHERYRAKNAIAISARVSKWKSDNREKLAARNRERYKSDIPHRLRVICRNRIYGALKTEKSIKTIELVGCTGQELKKYLESKFKPGMNWENQGTAWHVDHILPCASFDLSKESHQKRCFHYTNLQPLWGIENLRKNSKTIQSHQLQIL